MMTTLGMMVLDGKRRYNGMRTGKFLIELDDYSEDDDYNQNLSVEKEVYSYDDLITCNDAINLMVNFLRTLGFADNTIAEVLADNLHDLTQNAISVCNRKDRWEDERYEVLNERS